MTDQDVIDHLRQNTPLNQVRAALSASMAQAEQSSQQRFPPPPIEMRRREFESLDRILKLAQDVGLIKIVSTGSASQGSEG